MKKDNVIITVLAIAFSMSIFLSSASAADDYIVAVGQSQVLNFNGIQRVDVANPEIADAAAVSGSELLLVGKSPGGTTLQVWSSQGRRSIQVNVAAEDKHISSELQNMLGYPDLRAAKINQTIVLEGTVNDQYQRSCAEKAAGAYGEKVINLLELRSPKQVKIEAQIVEINSNKTNKLGILWGNTPSTPGAFSLGQSYTAANSLTGQNNIFGWFGSYADINAELDALIQTGDARIVSRPQMTALSGEKADVTIGGEIPVPVSVDNGQVGIEWKPYGVKLVVEPEVGQELLIKNKVMAEVSSIDWNSGHQISLGSGMSVPPLIINKAETIVTLKSGQTLVIGGLISTQSSRGKVKIPLLGDLPILGPVFRNNSVAQSKTELLILITPTVVGPERYQPLTTEGMQEFLKENPWQEGEKYGERRDKNSDR